mmetsp:Transcript_32225/g.55721  ORF Transcript_32225/g.55721 Transcript_32225/m.55721 type:complete len:122 (+) Transcript_32225:638-1003(+)
MGCYAFKQGEPAANICCYKQQSNELVLHEDPTELNEFNDLTLTSNQVDAQARSFRVLADLEVAFISTSMLDTCHQQASTPRFTCTDNSYKMSFESLASCNALMSPAFAGENKGKQAIAQEV